MDKLVLFNTLSRKKETFVPNSPPKVGLYTCGPTVYDFAHIGNLRTYLFEDVLRRTLTYLGYEVKHVMNVTDVGHLTSDADDGEDKMDKGAKREGKTVWDVAKFYTDKFFEDTKALNILLPHVVCKATDHIKQQIALIQELEKKSFVYDTGDVLYFDTSKFKGYGKIAKLDWEQLQEAQGRIDKDPKKRNISDFALWFRTVGKHQHHVMRWPSPWGEGFPGWHIECSAMSSHYLGKRFDIHCGGIDHISVHHPNEIAQSEAAWGGPWVKYWLHGEHLVIDNGRMGKSLGNFITLKSLAEKGFHPSDYRYFTFTAHYKTRLNFHFGALETAQATRKRLVEKVIEWKKAKPVKKESDKAKSYKQQFKDALGDDLNMPEALAVLWGVVKDTDLEAGEKLKTVLDFDAVLGLDLASEKEETVMVPEAVVELIAQREAARKGKDFKKADELREKIKALGYTLDDSEGKVKVRKL